MLSQLAFLQEAQIPYSSDLDFVQQEMCLRAGMKTQASLRQANQLPHFQQYLLPAHFEPQGHPEYLCSNLVRNLEYRLETPACQKLSTAAEPEPLWLHPSKQIAVHSPAPYKAT
jgi:hypothetical protein